MSAAGRPGRRSALEGRPPRGEASRSWPDTLSFDERESLIGFDVRPVFLEAVRPADVNAIGLSSSVQADMHREVVLRQIAATSLDLAELCHPSGDDPKAGTDRAAVRRRADQPQLEPVVIRWRRGPENVRCVV